MYSKAAMLSTADDSTIKKKKSLKEVIKKTNSVIPTSWCSLSILRPLCSKNNCSDYRLLLKVAGGILIHSGKLFLPAAFLLICQPNTWLWGLPSQEASHSPRYSEHSASFTHSSSRHIWLGPSPSFSPSSHHHVLYQVLPLAQALSLFQELHSAADAHLTHTITVTFPLTPPTIANSYELAAVSCCCYRRCSGFIALACELEASCAININPTPVTPKSPQNVGERFNYRRIQPFTKQQW